MFYLHIFVHGVYDLVVSIDTCIQPWKEHILSRLRENCMVDKCVRKDSSSCDPSRITRERRSRVMQLGSQ